MPSFPSFESTTRLVARALAISPEHLLADLRPARMDDLPAVLSLRQLEFGAYITWDDHAYLSWRYRLGRANCGLGELWVVTDGGSGLLGMIGTEEIACMHAGRRVPGVRAMDILVSPRAKNSGLGIWLNQALFQRGKFVLVVGSNPNSIGLMKRLYRDLPPGRLYHRYVDLQRYMTWRFGTGPAAWLGARFGNLLMWCWRHVLQLPLVGYSIQPIHRFDESTDIFLDNASLDTGDIVLERSSEYLNRRLFENPRAQYRVSATYKDGVCLGYIAWRIIQRGDGEIWMYIVDLVADTRSGGGALSSLLTSVAREAELHRCSFVGITVQNGAIKPALRRHGFLGPKADQVVTLHSEDKLLLDELCGRNWHLTDLSFDGDGY